MYHRIAVAEFDPFNIAVSPDEFERQLSRLRTKVVLPLTEFARLHDRHQLPKDAVAVTFDDGYACNALVAAPVLESFALPATFFIVSDVVTRSEEFWWDQLDAIVNAPGFNREVAGRMLASHSLPGVSLTKRPINSRRGSYLELWHLLRDLPVEERRICLDELRNQMGLENKVRPSHRPMTTAELRRLAVNPLFQIGGHTVTHPALSTRPPAEQEQEIVSGRRMLESTLGVPVACFSYPFGDWAHVTRDIVVGAAFECAVTAEARRVTVGDDRFLLPRRQALNRSAR